MLRNVAVVGSPEKGEVQIPSSTESFMDEQGSQIPSALHLGLVLAQEHQADMPPPAEAVV